MYFLYSVFIFFLRILLGTLALFDRKIRDGIEGRKNLFERIEQHYPSVGRRRKRILIHVSSFGELEQAKPVIEGLKIKYPEAHIHLTFFSPSGYNNAVNTYKIPDLVSYLPFDSTGNVRWFLDICKPDLVLFVRYDLWHNFIREVHDRNIPMMLFSATFTPSFGKSLPLMRSLYSRTYSFMNCIATINETDSRAIASIATHAREIFVGGDTRCDQVIARRMQVEADPVLVLPESVVSRMQRGETRVVVAGSTWEDDEEIIIPVFKRALEGGERLFLIIAPHEVGRSHVESILTKFGGGAIALSRISEFEDQSVIVVDSIGQLFWLYRYGTFAYVGGGFGAGVHNILEPAVWGAPAIVGPNHQRSKEIATLIGLGGAVEIRSADDFIHAFADWFGGALSRTVAASAARSYVTSSAGATEKIIEKIETLPW